MDKAVLISIQPQWCEKIASGEKTLEIRKTKPKLQTPFECYIYCTKAVTIYDMLWSETENVGIINQGYSGKVIGEFVCDEIIELFYKDFGTKGYFAEDIELQESCLSLDDLYRYGKGKLLYGWYISDLVIYDKPKQLSEFNINRAPQSWCYVQED